MNNLALMLALAACSGAPNTQPDGQLPDGGALQLNDVTVVFPITDDLLAASASGDRGTLLPAATYDAVGHIFGSGADGDAPYAKLRVVAMRLDPCFAALAPDPHGTGCANQLRLVLQDVENGGASDSAIHAFYSLSREDVLTIAHTIASLRVANSTGERLGALGPHPIMIAQGPGGVFEKGVRTLIQRYAGAENLVRITELSASNAGFSWTFKGFDLDASGTPAPIVIPSLTPPATSQSFFHGFGATLAGEFMPPTSSGDDLVPLANAQTAPSLSADARQGAFAGLVHIDNPTRNSPNTIDCASCHLATPISKLIAAPLGLDEATAADTFVADGTFVLPTEMTPRFDTTASFNLHACSYVDGNLAINQRTVNETAAIVAYLNQ